MFDILVYLFENYYTPQACPEAEVLAHRLADAGFQHEDINDALGWLSGLAQTTEQCIELAQIPQTNSQRIYTSGEYQTLGTQAIGFITFLENSGALSPVLREILIDRAQAVSESPVSLEKIKVIALMVLWSQEAEIDHLVFEELLTNDQSKLSH
jgi:Smg protein